MTVYTVLWLAWIVAFAVVEGFALRNDRKDDTLSEHLRLWFRTDTRPGRTVFLCVFGAFVAWFGVHIITKLV